VTRAPILQTCSCAVTDNTGVLEITLSPTIKEIHRVSKQSAAFCSVSRSSLSLVTLSPDVLPDNDVKQGLEAIRPDEISISHTGHILLSLTSNPDINGIGGRDLLVWGRNNESELGNGKRSNVVFPTPVQSPDEHERFMLREKKAREVKDLAGKVWKRGVQVKQQVVSGFNNSVVYWKIVN
jgi:hypothetical protein